MDLTTLLRDETLSAAQVIEKINERTIEIIHDYAYCKAIESDEDPTRAANEALSRLMDSPS